jgi:hypothetical protein
MYNSALLRRWLWVRVPPNPISIFRRGFPSETADKAEWQAFNARQ